MTQPNGRAWSKKGTTGEKQGLESNSDRYSFNRLSEKNESETVESILRIELSKIIEITPQTIRVMNKKAYFCSL
jgi:hypothetical protein